MSRSRGAQAADDRRPTPCKRATASRATRATGRRERYPLRPARASFAIRSKCLSRLSRNARRSARSAPERARITKSQGGSCWCIRKLSLASRLSLFRSTARLAARREIVRPSRATERSFGLASTVKYRSLERAGSAKTRPNSVGVCKRCRGVNPAGFARNAAPIVDPSGRETGAAFLPTACQDLAAAASCHPRTKTVGALAVQIARLKSAFHGEVTRKAKSALETKGCGPNESGELYAACAEVSRPQRVTRRSQPGLAALIASVDNCDAAI